MALELFRRDAILRRILPFGVILIGIALLIGLFLAITQRMNTLREAPGDNITWTLSQVEVDVLLLTDEALLAAIATEPRLMPHLHLSLQHGDDLILKRMKRRHLRDDAIAFC